MDNNQTPPPAQPAGPAQPPTQNSNSNSAQNHGMSNDTKTLIVILLLIFTYWIGLIFMWIWMKTWPNWLKIVLTLPVFASIALIAFFVYSVIMNPSQFIEETERTVNEKTLETPTPSPLDEGGTPSPTASPSAVQSVIESALTSETYADLVPYMAESVMFEIEASEGVGPGTPEETVTNLAYLNTAAAPWDFDQTNPIITSIKTQYAQEYGNLFIGISSNDVLAAFGFDQNNKINIIKVAVTYKLLVNE